MNREIKFRAWDTYNERMIYEPEKFIPTGPHHYMDEPPFNAPFQYYESWQDMEDGINRPCHIMQYAGLKDKNGKEIYEGDIGEIRTQGGRIERFIVEWGIHRREMKSGWTVDIPGFCFRIDGFPSFPIAQNYLNGHDLDIIEIVGNIFETPELLPTTSSTTSKGGNE